MAPGLVLGHLWPPGSSKPEDSKTSPPHWLFHNMTREIHPLSHIYILSQNTYNVYIYMGYSHLYIILHIQNKKYTYTLFVYIKTWAIGQYFSWLNHDTSCYIYVWKLALAIFRPWFFRNPAVPVWPSLLNPAGSRLLASTCEIWALCV